MNTEDEDSICIRAEKLWEGKSNYVALRQARKLANQLGVPVRLVMSKKEITIHPGELFSLDELYENVFGKKPHSRFKRG